MVVAKLRHKNPAMQIIALSATIGNPGDLAGWLDAELVESDWRPVDLREGVFFQNGIQFADHNREVGAGASTRIWTSSSDTVEEGGTVPGLRQFPAKNAEAFCETRRIGAETRESDPRRLRR